jgi:predicted DNA-binding protein (MmcQ/YjbR family)
LKENLTEKQILEKMRVICMALPGTQEKISHGHPAFATPKGIYAVLEEYGGELSMCVKVGRELQGVFLEDSRFYRTPYVGTEGWISLKVHAAPLNWEEVGELLTGSYQLVGTKSSKPKPSHAAKPRSKVRNGHGKRHEL